MGWYVTCGTCGKCEKYSHPACGCLEKKRKLILEKLIGATIVDYFIANEMYYVIMYTHYSKVINEEKNDIYVATVIENQSGENKCAETVREIDKEDYYTSKQTDEASPKEQSEEKSQ